MSVTRVSNSQTFSLLTDRAGQLEVQIRELQDQVSSGIRFSHPEDDPAGAVQVVRIRGSLDALAQYKSSSSFGTDVLGAQDKALGEADNLLTRAEEIATQQAQGLITPEQRVAAAEEVHGILQGLTALGNTEFAGRRLFSGLALDTPTAPFTDPDAPGYNPATAYTGSTQQFFVKTGGATTERVRVSTRGDTVFTNALVGVKALEDTLRANGDVAGTLPGLKTAHATISDERASVGARQTQLVDRGTQVAGLTTRQQANLADVQDTDVVAVISQLVQAQTALQTTLQAGGRLVQLSVATVLGI
jgi:flagellar hook-associated protein 3 FlgL